MEKSNAGPLETEAPETVQGDQLQSEDDEGEKPVDESNGETGSNRSNDPGADQIEEVAQDEHWPPVDLADQLSKARALAGATYLARRKKVIKDLRETAKANDVVLTKDEAIDLIGPLGESNVERLMATSKRLEARGLTSQLLDCFVMERIWSAGIEQERWKTDGDFYMAYREATGSEKADGTISERTNVAEMWVRFHGIMQFEPVWRWDISKQEEFAKVALDDDPEVQKRFALALETRLLGNMAQVELDKRVTTRQLATAVSQVRGRNRRSKKVSPRDSQVERQGGEDRITSFLGTDILEPKVFDAFERVLLSTATEVSKFQDAERQRLRFAAESLLAALDALNGTEIAEPPASAGAIHVNSEPLKKAS